MDNLKRLTAMPHVADVERSVAFYKLLGLETKGSLKNDDGRLQWVYLAGGGAELMLVRASEPLAKPATILYVYVRDLPMLRQQLIASGVAVSEITCPPYMAEGEVCLEDPDGYTLLIGQSN
jgi:catechol 2,3-dioxygenase-like lactoylglutathione lyase family enzyme